MIDLFVQAFALPLTVGRRLLEMLEEAVLQAVPAVEERMARVPRPVAPPAPAHSLEVPPPAPAAAPAWPPPDWRPSEPTTRQERPKMADTNLNDDMVKLVEYTLITIERGRERKLEGPKQIIVTDDLTGDAFSNARVAEWFERTKGQEEGRKIDSDTLRVYYAVLDRWPKEDLKQDEKTVRYQEEQLDVLRKIADRLPAALDSGSGSGAKSKSGS